MNTSLVQAFDGIAPSYDETFTQSAIGRAQRQAVWRMTDRVFKPGDRVLEINCGTGVDAVHLAELGVRVHACDISPGMLAIGIRRAQWSGYRVEFELRSIEDLRSLDGSYDGLLSNFGGLNCLGDLRGIAEDLQRLIRPGGNLVLCYMSSFCGWEMLWYLAQAQIGKAFRRVKKGAVLVRMGSAAEFVVHYPKVKEIRLAFSPYFRLAEQTGVGVLVPPSYLEAFAIAHPKVLRSAIWLDTRVAGWRLMRRLADHMLLRFERVPA